MGPDAGKSCEAEVDKMGDELMWAGFNDTPFDESVYSPKRNLHCVGFSKPGVGTLWAWEKNKPKMIEENYDCDFRDVFGCRPVKYRDGWELYREALVSATLRTLCCRGRWLLARQIT